MLGPGVAAVVTSTKRSGPGSTCGTIADPKAGHSRRSLPGCFNTLLSGTVLHRLRNVQKVIAEFTKLRSLEGLRKTVSDHTRGWAMCHAHMAIFDVVGYKIVPNVDMPSILCAGETPIMGQQHSALIVLENNIILYQESLRLEEVLGP